MNKDLDRNKTIKTVQLCSEEIGRQFTFYKRGAANFVLRKIVYPVQMLTCRKVIHKNFERQISRYSV